MVTAVWSTCLVANLRLCCYTRGCPCCGLSDEVRGRHLGLFVLPIPAGRVITFCDKVGRIVDVYVLLLLLDATRGEHAQSDLDRDGHTDG